MINVQTVKLLILTSFSFPETWMWRTSGSGKKDWTCSGVTDTKSWMLGAVAWSLPPGVLDKQSWGCTCAHEGLFSAQASETEALNAVQSAVPVFECSLARFLDSHGVVSFPFWWANLHAPGHLLHRVVHTSAGLHHRACSVRRVLWDTPTLHEFAAENFWGEFWEKYI